MTLGYGTVTQGSLCSKVPAAAACAKALVVYARLLPPLLCEFVLSLSSWFGLAAALVSPSFTC
jgi:hypothetical protein